MFNSVREKLYSVVHDGIDLDAVRKKISQVQEQAKPSPKKVHEVPTSDVNLGVGGEILTKYQNQWKEMHNDAENNAKTAEEIDQTMMQVHTSVKNQLESFVQMNTLLSTLPQVTSVIDDCVSQIKELAVLFEVVENDLINLEDSIEVADFQRRQLEHTFQLTMYKEKKLAALEKSRVSLVMQQAGSAKATELQQREALQQRQRAAHDAFLKDLTLYKTQGTLPKTTEVSNANDGQITLEEIHLDSEDTADLDEFLK